MFTQKFFLTFLSLVSHIVNTEAYEIFNNVDFTPRNLQRLSNICQQQYDALDIITKLKMFDASVKIPDGLGTLDFMHLGHFDECYNIEVKTGSDVINGQYCLGGILVSQLELNSNFEALLNSSGVATRVLENNPATAGLHLGYCIPSGCTTEDVANMTFGIVSFDEEYCYSKKTAPELSGGAIATLTVLGIFLGIVVISTVLDVVYEKLEKKVPHIILVAFSAYSNGKKLISSTSNPDQLLCLNGIRAISMMWVILCHHYQLALGGPIGSFEDLLNFTKEKKNMFLMGATVSVDTFFVCAGLVIVYTFLRAVDKGVKFNIFQFYLHRYIRLTPAFLIVILIQLTLLIYMGNGPMWNGFHGTLVDPCKQYWWSALLYIQNFVNPDRTCVPHSWYLSVDLQLFLLSPLILLPLKAKPKLGLCLLGIAILAGIIVPFAIGFAYEIPAYSIGQNSADKEELYRYSYYPQTHMRFGPYVIGMLLGYFIHKIKKNQTRITLHPVVYLSLWAISLAGLAACIFSYYDVVDYERWAHAFALGFLRNGWAAGLCIVIFLCVTGYGSFVNWFLSIPIFQFITKVSYAMYLVHYGLISVRYASTKYSFEFSHTFLLWSFWGDLVYTLVASVALCLTFESPIIILEKVIFGSGSNKNKETRKDVKQTA